MYSLNCENSVLSMKFKQIYNFESHVIHFLKLCKLQFKIFKQITNIVLMVC